LRKSRRDTTLRRTSAFCRHANSVGRVDALFYYMAYLGTPPHTTYMTKQAFEHCGAINLGTIMARMLDHFLYRVECLGNISPTRAVSAYHFRGGTDSCVVTWSTEGRDMSVLFQDLPSGISFYDAMGNPMEPSREGNSLSLQLYDTPVFVVGKKVTAERVTALFNSAEVRFPVAVYHTISARKGQMFFDVSVTNNMKQPVDIEVGVTRARYSPLKWAAAESRPLPAQPPGRTAVVSFPLKYGLTRHAEFKRLPMNVNVGENSFSTNVMMWLASSLRTTSPVRLDGALGDWASTLPVRIETTHVSSATRRMSQVRSGAITGAEELTQGRKPIIKGKSDISSLIYTKWDKKYLYFACAVRDDSVEKGDSIALFFDTNVPADRPDEKLSDDDYVFSFSVGQDQSTGKLKCGETTLEIPAAFGRTEDGYLIELSLPWKALGIPPAPGTTLGFDAAVTDTDKGTVHAQLGWSGAGYGWGDPTGFGTLVLGE
ncbi:MAG: sugar-binding protein, partial [Planctomycetota bacterium]|nr:sugar-binding protein [Planctomycetota bacterium]